MLVNEMFLSIQGEGRTMGLPTVFVRLSGCNLDCRWCDTRYAEEGGSEMSVEEVLEGVNGYRTRHVCLTGGEPLWHDGVPELISRLLEEGKQVSLETNGSLSIAGLPDHPGLMISMDHKCPSSGMEGRMLLENLRLLRPKDQLKFVVADQEDLEMAEDVLRKFEPDCPAIFTPVGGLTLGPVVEFVLKHKLEVRVLPQLHKLIWGERRGV
ncbi:MAG TPA: radical SAM protein [Methanomassiliicoccales archaeon]|nr:radical SAM protein [Methanomassiliicoccales archaeon]HPR98266.1 radical SAM protein [Methanomassiliicoccales archaeon]